MTDTNRTDTHDAYITTGLHAHDEPATPLVPAVIADATLDTSLRELQMHGLSIVTDMMPTQPAGGWDAGRMHQYFLGASERLKDWAARQLELAAQARATAIKFNATHFGDHDTSAASAAAPTPADDHA